MIDELEKAKKRFGSVSASFCLDEGNRSMWIGPQRNITASERKDIKKRGLNDENNSIVRSKCQKRGILSPK